MRSAGHRIDSHAPRGRRLALVLALSAGAFVIATCAARTQFGWLAWIALAPLFVAIRWLSPREACVAGVLWGSSLALGLECAGQLRLSWTQVALLVGVSAAYAGVGARLTRRFGYHPLLLALAWVPVELLLTPLPFRGGLLAGAQYDVQLFCALASTLGYACVAMLVVLANAALVAVCAEVRWRTFHLPTVSPRPATRPAWFRVCTAPHRAETLLDLCVARPPPPLPIRLAC